MYACTEIYLAVARMRKYCGQIVLTCQLWLDSASCPTHSIIS